MTFLLRRPQPRIAAPGPRLLADVPLRFVRAAVNGRGKKPIDAQIPLVPFVDFLITLVVFLLTSFSSSPDAAAQLASLQLPSAAHNQPIESAPVITIDASVVALDGRRIGDVPSLLTRGDTERIEGLAESLERSAQTWQQLHPGRTSPGLVLLSVDRRVDFRVVKKVLFTAVSAGFPHVGLAVERR